MNGKKLLVADDSLTIQKVIRLALSNEGYEIQTVSDGNDALQQIALFKPDIVLIDVSLPSKNAFEIKRATNAQASTEDLRFVLMSSAFEKVDEEQEAATGFHARLTKPFDPAHLRRMLTDVLSQAKAQEAEVALASPGAITLATEGPKVFPPRPSSERQTGSMARPTAFELPFTAPEASVQPPQVAGNSLSSPPPFQDLFQDSQNTSDLMEEENLPPIHPDEQQPLTTSSISEPAVSLWDHEEPDSNPFESLAPPPPPAPSAQMPSQVRAQEAPEASSLNAASTGSSDFNDIRQLTESTMRMSGLDDFQWSVNENARKPLALENEIALEQAHTHDLRHNQALPTSSPFEIEVPTYQRPNLDPSMRPLPAIADLGGTTFRLDLEPPAPTPAFSYHNAPEESDEAPTRELPLESRTQTEIKTHKIPSSTPVLATIGHAQVSSAQVEEIVRVQLEAALEKMAQRLLPEVAERIIKAEIRKMLQEQP